VTKREFNPFGGGRCIDPFTGEEVETSQKKRDEQDLWMKSQWQGFSTDELCDMLKGIGKWLEGQERDEEIISYRVVGGTLQQGNGLLNAAAGELEDWIDGCVGEGMPIEDIEVTIKSRIRDELERREERADDGEGNEA
jgi:hypothetical protein